MLRTRSPAVRIFYAVRYYLFGTLLLAYIIYDGLEDKYNFLLVLLLTALGIAALWWVISALKRARQPKRPVS